MSIYDAITTTRTLNHRITNNIQIMLNAVGAAICRPPAPRQLFHQLYNRKLNVNAMNELHTRKQIRLKEYDYSNNGCYFVTICTKSRTHFLWETTAAGNIHPMDCDFHASLSDYGAIVEKAINVIPIHYPYVTIDKYVIMPDHIHLLLTFSQCDDNGNIIDMHNFSLSTIIGQLKRTVSMKTGISLW